MERGFPAIDPVPPRLAAPLWLGAPARGAEATPDDGHAVDPRRRVDVLVIEDDPDALEAAVEVLENCEREVVAAGDAASALAWIEGGGRPALILLDLRMPDMDGWEFCERLAGVSGSSDLPVAILSAHAEAAALPRRGVDAGFFRKPVDWKRLLAAVDRWCGPAHRA